MPSMPSVPLISASPSLAASSIGAQPGRAQRLGRRRCRAPSLPSTQPSPSSTSAQCASGARSPEAPSEPCSGTHGVMSWLSRSTRACGDQRADPGAAQRQRPDPQQHHRPDHLARHRRADAGGVRADQRVLQLGPPLRGDERVGQRAEAGGDAVHRAAVALDAVHDGPAGAPSPSTAAGASSTRASPRATASTSAGVIPVGLDGRRCIMAALRCAGRAGQGHARPVGQVQVGRRVEETRSARAPDAADARRRRGAAPARRPRWPPRPPRPGSSASPGRPARCRTASTTCTTSPGCSRWRAPPWRRRRAAAARPGTATGWRTRRPGSSVATVDDAGQRVDVGVGQVGAVVGAGRAQLDREPHARARGRAGWRGSAAPARPRCPAVRTARAWSASNAPRSQNTSTQRAYGAAAVEHRARRPAPRSRRAGRRTRPAPRARRGTSSRR